MTLKNSILIAIILLLFTACDSQKQHYADRIYLNGNILTINDKNPLAEALATKNGLIEFVGNMENTLALKGPNTQIFDLKGNTLLPGFIDAHSHFAGVGMQSVVANLLPMPDGPVSSITDLQTVLKEFLNQSSIAKKYNVVIGFNYDDSQLKEQRHPTRHELDEVSTELPVVIMHQSGHIGVYNTKALGILGITADTINPNGGIIEREKDGKTPNGVLQENAHFSVFYKMLPNFTQEDLVALYKAGEQSYISNGFTTAQDGKTDLATLKLLPEIAKNEGFDIDIISYADLKELKDNQLLTSELMSNKYQNRFRIGGVKLTFDGSPQGKTAWFSKPYFKPPLGQTKAYAGYPAFKDEEAYQLMQLAYKNSWQLLIHTNGDAAIDQLLRLVEKAKISEKQQDHRTVMIHGQYTRKDQITRLKALGIFPSLYPMHTFYWGDWHRDSVAGPDRAKNISPTGWMLDNKIPFSIHSDAPVTFPNSMRILDSAINRVTRTNKVLGEEHKLHPLIAIKAMTIWSAFQHFEENIKGSLEVGKQADFVILNANPLKIEPSKIKDIKVLTTINDDIKIYERTKM